mmetsp:Transcript_25278/g.74211  ORF Transcript_25278/g.74211 Transcript_25278/m.74211 type:complete len:545 (-) Transcript_25278:372-2006(-)
MASAMGDDQGAAMNKLRARQRSTSSTNVLRSTPGRSNSRRDLSSHLSVAAARDVPFDQAALTNVRTSLVASLEDDVRRYRAEAQQQISRASRMEEMLREAMQQLEKNAQPALEAAARARALVADKDAELDRARERALELEARASALEADLEAVHTDRSQLAMRLGAAEQTLASRDLERNRELTAALADKEAAESRAAAAREEAERAKSEAASARAEADGVRGELGALAARADAAEREAAGVREGASHLEALLHEAREQVKRAEGDYKALARDASQHAGTQGQLNAMHKAHRAELARLQAELSTATAALAGAQNDKHAAEKKAAAAKERANKLGAEAAELKKEKATASDELVRLRQQLAAAAKAAPQADKAPARRGSKQMDGDAPDKLSRSGSLAKVDPSAARLEARARDAERKLDEMTRARDDLAAAVRAADLERDRVREALALAEEEIKKLAPRSGSWKQGVIPASKQVHASHFVRMVNMQREIQRLQTELSRAHAALGTDESGNPVPTGMGGGAHGPGSESRRGSGVGVGMNSPPRMAMPLG